MVASALDGAVPCDFHSCLVEGPSGNGFRGAGEPVPVFHEMDQDFDLRSYGGNGHIGISWIFSPPDESVCDRGIRFLVHASICLEVLISRAVAVPIFLIGAMYQLFAVEHLLATRLGGLKNQVQHV